MTVYWQFVCAEHNKMSRIFYIQAFAVTMVSICFWKCRNSPPRISTHPPQTILRAFITHKTPQWFFLQHLGSPPRVFSISYLRAFFFPFIKSNAFKKLRISLFCTLHLQETQIFMNSVGVVKIHVSCWLGSTLFVSVFLTRDRSWRFPKMRAGLYWQAGVFGVISTVVAQCTEDQGPTSGEVGPIAFCVWGISADFFEETLECLDASIRASIFPVVRSPVGWRVISCEHAHMSDTVMLTRNTYRLDRQNMPSW